MKKVYQFEFIGSHKGYGVVTASNKEEAIDLINNNDYDDIIDTYDTNIEDITKIEEIEDED